MRRIRRMRLIPAHAGKTRGSTGPGVGWWAHPRSRGENSCASHMAAFRFGSSPLTRGKRAGWSATAKRWRLIPAHAGKTRHRQSARASASAHPRSRGENGRAPRISAPHTGSSPLTRGKRARAAHLRAAHGLIPAHAGKTLTFVSWLFLISAHPRSRGENQAVPYVRACIPGSSPLTRGKRTLCRRVGRRLRLIPAHAGKTQAPARELRVLRAHPRSRGENPSQ